MATRILVVGGAKVRDEHVRMTLAQIVAHYKDVILITSANGGFDNKVLVYCSIADVAVARVPSYWQTGFRRRNANLLKLKPDLVVAFKGDASTDDVKLQAGQAGLPVYEV